MDITDTTATSDEVLDGKVFYAASGTRSVGTLGDATQSSHGLMSSADKTKLDNISVMQGAIPNAGSVSATGTISFKHDTTELFTVQLPIYSGGVTNG